MGRFRIPLPLLGVSDADSFTDQAAGTTREAQNMDLRCPVTNRKRLSQRAGMSKWAPAQPNPGNKISVLQPLSYDARNQSYTTVTGGQEPSVRSDPSPSNPRLVPIVRRDSQSNRYFVDGSSTIVKQNSDGVEQYKITVPTKPGLQRIRALWVDEADTIYCATGGGLSIESSQIYCYRQRFDAEDDSLEHKLFWTLETEFLVEDICVREGKLVTIQNSAILNEGWLVVYDGLFLSQPIESWRRKCIYPNNALAISPKDSSIFVTGEANALRGYIPDDPNATPTTIEWTPLQLAYFGKRAWSWLDATDVDGNGTFNEDYEEGDAIPLWVDKTENGRNLYQNVAPSIPPTLNKRGCAGRATLHFGDFASGSAQSSLVSGSNTSIEASGASQQMSLLPGYAGARWIAFFVLRCDASATMRQLLTQTLDGGNFDGAVDFGLFLNTTAAAGVVSNTPGAVQWYDRKARVQTAGPVYTLQQPVPQYWTHEQCDGYAKTNTMLIALEFDGNAQADVNGVLGNSKLWVDGRLACAWYSNSATTWTAATEIGKMVSATGPTPVGLIGDLCEILVLRDYTPTILGTQTLIDETYTTSGLLSDSEWQRVTGYLAHKWGIAHKLPRGSQGRVDFTAVAANLDTVTVAGKVYTFKTAIGAADGDVLRGGSALASATNLGHAINLTGNPGVDYAAATTRNATVTALESYYPPTTLIGADVNLILMSRSQETTSFTLASTGVPTVEGGSATGFHVNGPTSITDNVPYSHQPHPYWLKASATTAGGAPREGYASTTYSREALLNDPGPILAKFDPSKGDVKWALVNPTTTDLGLGGFGYGVAVSKNGYVFCMGPMSTTALSGGATADQKRETYAVVRAVLDNGDSFVSDHTLAVGGGPPWVGHNGSADPPVGPFYDPEYHYPRLDTDKFDNCFFPWSSIYTTYGALKLAFNSGPFFRIQAATSITFPDFQRGCASAPDPNPPTYDPDNPNVAEYADFGCTREVQYTLTSDGTAPANNSTVTIGATTYTFKNPFVNAAYNVDATGSAAVTLTLLKRAINEEAGPGYGTGTVRNPLAGCVSSVGNVLIVRPSDPTVTLATAVGGVSHLSWSAGVNKPNVLQRKRFVTTTPATGSPRNHIIVIVAGQNVYRATPAGVVSSLGGGTGTGVIDAAAQFVSHCTHRGKVVLTDGIMPTPFVFDPLTNTGSFLEAEDGGKVPQRAKLCVEFRDRLGLARTLDNGHSLFFSEIGKRKGWNLIPLVPTPKQATSIEGSDNVGSVSDVIQALYKVSDDLLLIGTQTSLQRLTGDPAQGGAPHIVTLKTGVAFGHPFASDGKNVYFVGFPEGGIWMCPPGCTEAVEISDQRIAQRLKDINWATHTRRLEWDQQRDTLWVIDSPYANPGTQIQRWRWSRETKAWWPDVCADPAKNPTTLCYLDGDLVSTRSMLFGCSDGYIRIVDDAAKNDDGTAIDAFVLCGPFAPKELPFEFTFDDLQIVCATDQDGLGYEVFATSDPSILGPRQASGVVPPGRSEFQNCRSTAAYTAIRLRNTSSSERFSIEEVSLDGWPAGIKRRSA